jgi:ATP-dependent DNA helicase RecQ
MLGYCEAARCRRVVLLDYFGEKSTPCGNCDTCLEPPETWDGTIAAQMLFSAALRTRQRFGAGQLIDILRGKPTAKISQYGHDRLPTFGVGAEHDELTWRSVVRQLVALGLLRADPGRYGALELTAAARPVLRGETRLPLRRPRQPKARPQRRHTAPAPAGAGQDDALFEALRALRRSLADSAQVPPYVIFHDRTLREIAARKPRTEDELGLVSGIGENKLSRYGSAVLNVLRGFTPAK